MDPILLESREKIVKALIHVENIETITKDPTCYINQHFDQSKKHINWRRIDLKAEIDQYCDKLLEENESNRLKCLQLSNGMCQVTKKVNETKEKLHFLIVTRNHFYSTKISCSFSMTVLLNTFSEK